MLFDPIHQLLELFYIILVIYVNDYLADIQLNKLQVIDYGFSSHIVIRNNAN